MTAEFTLRAPGIEAGPLEARDVIRARDCAVPAPDAFLGGPADDATFRVLMQGLERTTGCARRIQAMHALSLHEGEGRSVLGLVELDDVARNLVQVGRRLV